MSDIIKIRGYDFRPVSESPIQRPWGVVLWGGTINHLPAILCSYYGGADVCVFIDGQWTYFKTESTSDAKEMFGIEVGQ